MGVSCCKKNVAGDEPTDATPQYGAAWPDQQRSRNIESGGNGSQEKNGSMKRQATGSTNADEAGMKS